MNKNWKETATVVATTALVTELALAAESQSVDELIANIKSKDDKARGAAWQNAGPSGAAAVQALAELMVEADMETARSAKRALWQIVRYAGRPGAAKEQKAVVTKLIALLASQAATVKREVLWMLSEIGGDEAVGQMYSLLKDAELREDACLSLQRIPGRQATAALKKGLGEAAEEFKPVLAQALRARGEKVEGYPSQKLVPTKQTSLKMAPVQK